jgi:hypothetical protein
LGSHQSAKFDERTNTIEVQSGPLGGSPYTLELGEGGRTVEKICYFQDFSAA